MHGIGEFTNSSIWDKFENLAENAKIDRAVTITLIVLAILLVSAVFITSGIFLQAAVTSSLVIPSGLYFLFCTTEALFILNTFVSSFSLLKKEESFDLPFKNSLFESLDEKPILEENQSQNVFSQSINESPNMQEKQGLILEIDKEIKLDIQSIEVNSPMPGKWTSRVHVGDWIEKGSIIGVVEAMKMEASIRGVESGYVIYCQEDGIIESNSVIMRMSKEV